MIKTFLFLTLSWLIFGCGVKGDPLPPQKPTDIGRGKPTYRRALGKIKLPAQKDNKDNDDDQESSDDE